jgi:hypothetical protein
MPDPTLRAPGNTALRATVDLLACVETTLDHPIENVWPYILHWNLWVDSRDYVQHRVAGSPDTIGEVKQITHLDGTGRMDASFFATIVKIVPHQQLIYKLWSPSYGYDAVTGISTEVPLTGYEVFNLREEIGHTVVSFYVFAESRPTGVTEAQAQGMSNDYSVDTKKRWRDKYFPKLNELLSSAHIGEAPYGF